MLFIFLKMFYLIITIVLLNCFYFYFKINFYWSIVALGFPDSSVGKESTCNAGDPGLIPGLGRSPGEGKGYPLQCSGLENSMDCIVHGIIKNRTWLSDFHTHRVVLQVVLVSDGAKTISYSYIHIYTHTYIYIYPLSFIFPSHLGHHRTLNRVLVLYSGFSLVVCFMHGIYMSIPISQLISPPHPRPLVYICLFSISVSLFMLCN